MPDRSQYPVQATATSFRVLEAIAARDSAGVTELAEALDLSKGAVHKHLTTLHDLGYVVRDGQRYALGTRFLAFGTLARERIDLYGVARSAVDDLAKTTDATASLVVADGDEAVSLYSAGDPDHRPRAGTRRPLPESAAGRAILANRPDDGRAAPGEGGDAPADLQRIRERGLAFDRTEDGDDTRRSVAAPITDTDGTALGAIAVTGPASDLSGKRLKEDVAGLVVSAAKRVKLDYTSS